MGGNIHAAPRAVVLTIKLNNETLNLRWFTNPCDAPSSAGKAGGFGNHLFEVRIKPRSVWLVRVSLIDARLGEQHRGS
jgi:hypothetical protein